MKFFLPIIFLLGISRNVLGKGIRSEKSNNDYELSYQELINMNISCYPSDSCMEFRKYDPPVPTLRKCSCHSQCWEYGTCCIDSPYRDKPPIQKCLGTYYRTYYMVHRCPDNTHPDSIWRNHCERELNDTDRILSIAPVTSLDTSRTYKNYYCFRCHETTDKYVSWNLDVTSDDDAPREAYISSVTYNQTKKTWVAIFDESSVSIPVRLNFLFPHNVQAEVMVCDLLSNCPELADERVHAKCLAYSAVVYTAYLSYKNVHCAFCNHVPLEDLNCNQDAFFEPESRGGGHGGRRIFRCMMDVNGGEEENQCFKKDDAPCNKDNHIRDPYSKKCHKIGCNVPGYVLKNDRCVKP